RRQGQELLLSTGQQMTGVVGMVGEAVAFEYLLDSSSSFVLVQPGAPEGEVDVLGDGGHDDLCVGIGGAEADASAGPRRLAAGVGSVGGPRPGGGDCAAV